MNKEFEKALNMDAMVERMQMVKAMEFIARKINDESVLVNGWLSLGVADGDIECGDLDVKMPYEEDVVWDYVEDDESFADLMRVFLDCMVLANKHGGLYCGGVVSK